jgi:hypothetical protein
VKKVARSELLDLPTYDARREEIRPGVLAQKALRRIHVGDALTFLFENAETARYQILEMIRVERLFREPEILHELETYNELLGGKGELGCALLIELTEPEARDRKLREWRGLPAHLYARLADGRKVRATFDERQVGDDRLSSVQYLKFDVGGEAPVALGSDLPELTVETVLAPEQRAALAADLASDG